MPSPLSQTRPDGSTQVLRYRLNGISVGEAAATYPKTNATFPSDSGSFEPTTFEAWVRFALFNPDFVELDKGRRLPAGTFDDGVLAGASPHSPVPCLPSSLPGINASDLSLDRRTWAQNIQIHYNKIDPNVVIADVGISIDESPGNGALVLLDTLSSGLGMGTGLPVVAIRFVVLLDAGDPQPFDVDITIEVRHSGQR